MYQLGTGANAGLRDGYAGQTYCVHYTVNSGWGAALGR